MMESRVEMVTEEGAVHQVLRVSVVATETSDVCLLIRDPLDQTGIKEWTVNREILDPMESKELWDSLVTLEVKVTRELKET